MPANIYLSRLRVSSFKQEKKTLQRKRQSIKVSANLEGKRKRKQVNFWLEL